MNFKYTPAGSTKKYNMFLVTRSFAKQLQLRLYIAGLDLPWHIGTVPGASPSGGRRYRALRLDGNCRRNLAKTFPISFLFVSHIWQENAAKIWLFFGLHLYLAEKCDENLAKIFWLRRFHLSRVKSARGPSNVSPALLYCCVRLKYNLQHICCLPRSNVTEVKQLYTVDITSCGLLVSQVNVMHFDLNL